MSTENLTAEQALHEVLDRTDGLWLEDMARCLIAFTSRADEEQVRRDSPLTFGDLRLWGALRSTKG